MAEIWVDRKCGWCGKKIVAGEKAILIATVKTTSENTYGSTSKYKSRVRVNFFTKSPRELQHLECVKNKNGEYKEDEKEITVDAV